MICLIDIDNVIADDAHRIHLIDTSTPHIDKQERYHEYHMAMVRDTPGNQDLWRNAQHGIILVTSRPDRYAGLTMQWLSKHGIPWELLLMRRYDEFDPSPVVKRRLVLSLPSYGFALADIVCAYDDRQDVIDMYVELGIPAERRWIHGEDLYPKVVI